MTDPVVARLQVAAREAAERVAERVQEGREQNGDEEGQSLQVGRVGGIIYSVTTAEAKNRGWLTFGLRPVGRGGDFVLEREFLPGEHKYLDVPALGVEFYSGEHLLLPDIDRTLARARPSASEFVRRCSTNGWYRSTEALGPFSAKLEVTLDGLRENAEWGTASDEGSARVRDSCKGRLD